MWVLKQGRREREVADIMERRKLDILRVQETEWKGSKTRNFGGGWKLIYDFNGADIIVRKK